MSNLSKKYATDESFREVANLLFGAGADDIVAKRELSEKQKRERTQARIGLASNVVGIGAGVAGLKDAAKSPHLRGKVGARRVERIKISRGTKALAAGAVGLQVANLGGDLVANRVLARSAKSPDTPKVSKMEPGGSDLSVPGGKLSRLADSKVRRYKAQGKSADYISQKAKHAVGKSFSFECEEFSKVDSDKRQVFGWASIVSKNGEPVVDLQGDYIDIEEIEKSAYDYVIKSRQGGDMHARNGEAPKVVGTMIESFLVTPEKIEKMGLPPETPLGWWVGYQVEDDDVWNLVKSGKRTGFSIHGRGQRTPSVI